MVGMLAWRRQRRTYWAKTREWRADNIMSSEPEEDR